MDKRAQEEYTKMKNTHEAVEYESVYVQKQVTWIMNLFC